MHSTVYALLQQALAAEQPVAVATVIAGATVGTQWLIRPQLPTVTTSVDASLTEHVTRDAQQLLDRGNHGELIYGETTVFVECYPPPPTIIMVGAVHIAVDLTSYAKVLGFRTVVIDARGAFATAERFAHADELVHAWPDEALQGRLHVNTAVVVLTHDPKLDDPALQVALPSSARYVGALGSKKTHAARVERLRASGVSEADIARLHAPIGLPIGGRTPAEIALSIIAEIVAVRNERQARRE